MNATWRFCGFICVCFIGGVSPFYLYIIFIIIKKRKILVNCIYQEPVRSRATIAEKLMFVSDVVVVARVSVCVFFFTACPSTVERLGVLP